jgi:cytochrome c oxidase subunit 2
MIPRAVCRHFVGRRILLDVIHSSLIGVVVAGRWWLPRDSSVHGAAMDRHLLLNLWIALALLTVAHVILFVGVLARRRRGELPESARWPMEYFPLVVLVLVFVFLMVKAERLWAATRYTGADLAALQVEADGVQFAWYFRYPGDDAFFGRTSPQLVAAGEGNPLGLDPADTKGHDDVVSSELVLPAGREVDLRIRAQDVMHGFSVPELRIKQDAVPGETIHIHFTPTVAGTYAILCTQLCGLGHYRMNATLRVLPRDEFATWLDAKEARR